MRGLPLLERERARASPPASLPSAFRAGSERGARALTPSTRTSHPLPAHRFRLRRVRLTAVCRRLVSRWRTGSPSSARLALRRAAAATGSSAVRAGRARTAAGAAVGKEAGAQAEVARLGRRAERLRAAELVRRVGLCVCVCVRRGCVVVTSDFSARAVERLRDCARETVRN